MTATELQIMYVPLSQASRTDPARLAALAVLSSAGVSLAGLDLDRASCAMARELSVSYGRGWADAASWLPGEGQS